MKTVILGNIVMKSIFAVCVTLAAIYFNKSGILWWNILLPFLGYSYTETTKKKGETDGTN